MISEDVIARNVLLRRVPRERLRIYRTDSSCVFWFTSREYGEFSNMSDGFPLHVNGIEFITAEALYQACKFPRNPEVQAEIVGARTSKAAKKISRSYASLVRADWMRVRVEVMRWVLRVKGVQHKKEFLFPLVQTDDSPIVEESSKDVFWGALRIGEYMVGMNVLGRLLMELREGVRENSINLMQLAAPNGLEIRLLGEEVAHVVPRR